MSNILVYELEKKIYINLTNRCSNECIFCLRQDKDDVCGQELWLENEDFTAEDVIAQYVEILRKAQDDGIKLADEVVFCGYGEPMLKFEILRRVAKYIKENYPEIKVRVNTNGHANFIYKKNVVPELVGLVDEFSVSLNASTAEEYDELSQPKFVGAYEAVKDFIKCSSESGIKTVASIVDGYKGRRLDVNKCQEIAQDLGAQLRVREWILNGYS
ncbi:MAG: TatD family nuclease-associated radical SAM protein [Muribaculaceae bacterium]|nr:TatD family nuclease-associated radical SAM protein [Muribaculaceae bacterium]